MYSLKSGKYCLLRVIIINVSVDVKIISENAYYRQVSQNGILIPRLMLVVFQTKKKDIPWL